MTIKLYGVYNLIRFNLFYLQISIRTTKVISLTYFSKYPLFDVEMNKKPKFCLHSNFYANIILDYGKRSA